MKKSLFIITIMFMLFSCSLVVHADTVMSDITPTDQTLLEELKNGYNSMSKIEIKADDQIVRVYGKSECYATKTKCDYSYSGENTVEDYFKRYIVCPNGENRISYQAANVASSSEYKDNYTKGKGDTVYWREEYSISCLSEGNSSNSGTVVDIPNEGTTGGSSSEYPGSSTVPNEDTGVFTYYIILLVIAFISYVILILSKKYNLFKKI